MAGTTQQPAPAQAQAQQAQNQQLALLQQILAVLRGASSVSMTNPNLVYNYGVAVTPHQYTSNFAGSIIQQLIPAPLGPLVAPFLSGLVADYLTPESYSILPWKRTYINPSGASGQGFAQSITYKRRVQQLSTQTQSIFNKALQDAAGGKDNTNGLEDVLQFFGLDQQQKSATRAAVAGSASIMLSRYGTDAKLDYAIQGVAQASAEAAAGRYYGNFSGQSIGQLSQILAARGAFDEFLGKASVGEGQLNDAKDKIKKLSRALQPLRDIFGNDIKALVSSVQTLYGTGIDALGPDRLLQISSNIRGTMYATGARMQVIQKAQESAVEYRRALAPDSSPNLVFNDLNAALTYTMRTERARSSAFMSTDDYRNATMRDIVATGTSSYADMVNKAYGAWVRTRDEKQDKSITAFQNELADLMKPSGEKPGMSRTAAILKLAGKDHPAQLMRTAQSDYAQRSGLGARLAYAQNYQDRLRDVQAKHTMFLDSGKAGNIAAALEFLGEQGLSDIFALGDDRDAFRAYMDSKNNAMTAKGKTALTAAEWDIVYNIATDTKGGNALGAMAHAQVTQQRAQDLKKKLDELGARYNKAQARQGKPGGDMAMLSSTGIWSMLQAGELKPEDANALLELAGLKGSFSYAESKNTNGQVKGIQSEDKEIQAELDKLSAQQRAKLLSSAHAWAPGVFTNGKLDKDKFIAMLHGTPDVMKKLNAMSGLSTDMRTSIEKQYTAAIAGANNADAWQTAGTAALGRASEYIAVGGLGPYLASQKLDADGQRRVITTLRQEMEKGRTLKQLVEAQTDTAGIDLTGDGHKTKEDKALLSTIYSYVSSQGQSQIPIMLQSIWTTLQDILKSIPKP